MYISGRLQYTMNQDICRNAVEAQSLTLKLDDGSTLSFTSVYRSPNSLDINNKRINSMIRRLGGSMHSHIVIVGDFNMPKIDWMNMTTRTQQLDEEFYFTEAIRDAYLTQHIDQPTRGRGGDRPSLLDLILTDEVQPTPEIEYCSPLGKSDHSLFKIKLGIGCRSENPPKKRLNYRRGNYERMRMVLDIDWTDTLNREQTTEDKWNKFRTVLDQATTRCIPEMKIRSGNSKKTPVDKQTLSKIRRKKRLWKDYLENGGARVLQEYRRVSNQVRAWTRKDAKKKEKEIAENIKTNPKRFWAHVNRKTRLRESIPPLVTENGNTTETKEEKVQVLSKFFSSVFLEEPPGHWNLPEGNWPDISEEVNITEASVLKELEILNTDKSPGFDQIHPRVLKETRERIAKPLSIILNDSIQTGEVPHDWRLANITAIHKKGNKALPNNYRPVSLTSICSKIMEKHIRSHLMDHLRRHNILSTKQYGFVSGRSTLLQLLRVMDSWTESLDRGEEVDVIFLDFKKAFDSVPHGRLLDKLKYYGVKGRVLNWIKNFLSDRRQRVSLQGTTSNWERVTSGVPQGSVLGPSLFIVFINSLGDSVDSEMYLFADDAKVFRGIRSPQDKERLQGDLDTLNLWTENSMLKFNADKCSVLTLSGPRTQTEERAYQMNGTNLEHHNSEKDLGVTVDKHLTFESHILDKVNKANRIMGLIRKSFISLNKQNFLLLYKALVRPHLEYCNQIWKPNLMKHIRIIENVQRRATRQLPGMSGKTYSERLEELNLPTLSYRRKRGDMIQLYKICSGKCDPAVTEGLLSFNPRQSRGHSKKLLALQPRMNLRRIVSL